MIETPEKIEFKKGKLLSAKVYQEFFPTKPSETVLNVGCGDGVQAIIYKGYYKRMVGVDINTERLETAKKLMEFYGIDNFETIGANVENIPLNEKFDKALAIDIIEHVMNPENFVLEINRLLKAGGELLITFPLMHDKWTALFRFVGRKILRRKGKTVRKQGWDPDAHQRERKLREWMEIMDKSGFRLIKSRATTMFPPLHYLRIPKFWYTINFIHKIDNFFCGLPVIKNFGSTLMCKFKKYHTNTRMDTNYLPRPLRRIEASRQAGANMRKITIAAGIFPPDIGGPAIYAVRLADALAERGWKVRVVCYAGMKHVTCNMKQYEFPVFRVLRRGNVFLRYFRYFWRLVRVARDSDIIYAQGPISAGLPGMLVAKLLRKKFMVKVVGDPAWEQAIGKGWTNDMIDEFQKKKYGDKIERLKKIRSFVCRKADLVIAPSRYLGGIVVNWGIARNKIKVVYNAIEDNNQDTGDNPPAGGQTITNNQIPNFQNFRESNNNLESDNYDIILSVGRLVKWKGMDKLIEIMPELLKENPRFKLMILGDGPENKNYQLSIINYQLEDKVELIGKVSHEEVMNYLNKAKMFVLNTGYEGLPHIVLEAMQAGCPVITTNVGGNPEVMRDGENGLLVEYNNKEQLKKAILKLWRDESLRKQLTAQAEQDLEKFGFERMVEETEDLLTGLIR